MLHEIALQIADWPIAEQGVAQHSLVHTLWLHLHPPDCSDASMDSVIVMDWARPVGSRCQRLTFACFACATLHVASLL